MYVNLNKTKKGFIDVLNEKILLKKSYINYFALAEWNLKEEMIYIYFEKEQMSKLVKNYHSKSIKNRKKNYKN